MTLYLVVYSRSLLFLSTRDASWELMSVIPLTFLNPAAGQRRDLLQCPWGASVIRGGGWGPLQGGDGAMHQPHHAGAAEAQPHQPPHPGLSVTSGTRAVAAALH